MRCTESGAEYAQCVLEVLHRCVDCLLGMYSMRLIPNAVAFAKETAGTRVDKEGKATDADADAGRRAMHGLGVRPGPNKIR